MVKKPHFPVVSPEVRASSVCAFNKAAERRQIISFKVPLRIVTLHDTVGGWGVRGGGVHRSYKSLFAATTHSPLAVLFSHLILLLPFQQPSPHFSSQFLCSFNHHLLTCTSCALAQAQVSKCCSLLPKEGGLNWTHGHPL